MDVEGKPGREVPVQLGLHLTQGAPAVKPEVQDLIGEYWTIFPCTRCLLGVYARRRSFQRLLISSSLPSWEGQSLRRDRDLSHPPSKGRPNPRRTPGPRVGPTRREPRPPGTDDPHVFLVVPEFPVPQTGPSTRVLSSPYTWQAQLEVSVRRLRQVGGLFGVPEEVPAQEVLTELVPETPKH